MLRTHSSCITSALTPDDLVEIRDQSTVEEAEEPEPVERIMRISKSSDWYGLIEATISVSVVH